MPGRRLQCASWQASRVKVLVLWHGDPYRALVVPALVLDEGRVGGAYFARHRASEIVGWLASEKAFRVSVGVRQNFEHLPKTLAGGWLEHGPVSRPNSTEADQHQAFFICGVQFFGFVFGEISEHRSHAANPIRMVLFDFAFVRLFDFVKGRER